MVNVVVAVVTIAEAVVNVVAVAVVSTAIAKTGGKQRSNDKGERCPVWAPFFIDRNASIISLARLLLQSILSDRLF